MININRSSNRKTSAAFTREHREFDRHTTRKIFDRKHVKNLHFSGVFICFFVFSFGRSVGVFSLSAVAAEAFEP